MEKPGWKGVLYCVLLIVILIVLSAWMKNMAGSAEVADATLVRETGEAVFSCEAGASFAGGRAL